MASVVSMGTKPAPAMWTAPWAARLLDQASAQKEQQRTVGKSPAAVEQAQRTQQQQSLAMVQIMLHASLGTLFYLREFLPLSCFGECDLLTLSNNSPDVSYQSFASGNVPEGAADIPGKRGQPLKVILRNRHEKADGLLNLLERGVFDALSKNILDALQLTIFVDKNEPTHVLESYTFTFNYTGTRGDASSRLASISLAAGGRESEVKTFRTAKQGLESIIRRLITLSAFLPVLPNKRFLEFHLFYTEDCPAAYEPTGFKSASNDHVLWPRNEDWTRESQSCGTMEGGLHTVGLKVTSLKWSGTETGDVSTRPEIPESMDYCQRVSREEDIGIDRPDLMMQSSQGGSQEPTQQSTQTRRDTAAKTALQNMLVPSTPNPNLTPTQRYDTQKGTSMAKPALSQQKLFGMRLYRDNSVSVSGVQSKLSKCDLQTQSSGNVDCQCGWNHEDGDMLQCHLCDTLQHAICYGFQDKKDPRIPDQHACYRCLLEEEEPALLTQMGTLALLRRALKVLTEEGYPKGKKEFADKLHCDSNVGNQITELLKKKGLLLATQGSHHKGFAAKGLPKYQIPDTPETKDKIRKEIFNPLAKIACHYTIPEDWQGSTAVEEESLDIVMQGRGSQRNASQTGDRSVSGEASYRLGSAAESRPGRNESVELGRTFLNGRRSSPKTRPRQWSFEEDTPSREVPATQGSAGSGRDFAQRKKRKLSRIRSPVDVCDPMDEDDY